MGFKKQDLSGWELDLLLNHQRQNQMYQAFLDSQARKQKPKRRKNDYRKSLVG